MQLIARPLLSILFSSLLLAWCISKTRSKKINLIGFGGSFLCYWLSRQPYRVWQLRWWAFSANSLVASVIGWLNDHVKMLLTGTAVAWLVHRAWQTLWRPVPELINILGVDVPDAPDVVLAGIRSDAATLYWTRPQSNRPVHKFLIQVNGVVVGDVAANQEPAIVVSGFKPNHFYNIRVIAVGLNAFQAGSKVVRLQTHGKDARPQLGNGRVPANFMLDDAHVPGLGEDGEENGGSRSLLSALDMTAANEGTLALAREGGLVTNGPARRTAVEKRHSPSTTSIDQLSVPEEFGAQPEQSLTGLTERFESIRKETEETLGLTAKEEADNRRVLDELETEKQQKRKEHRKKEEQTEILKKDMNHTERAMRNAMQRKAQKERQLKEKKNERTKLLDSIRKFEKGVQDMQTEMESYEQQRQQVQNERDKKVECLREINLSLQDECVRLEAALKLKRDRVTELEDARKRLPGGEADDEWRDRDAVLKRTWQRKLRDLNGSLHRQVRWARVLDEKIRVLSMQMQQIERYTLYAQPRISGLDQEKATFAQLKRQSRNSGSISSASFGLPLSAYSPLDAALSGSAPAFSSPRVANVAPGFAPGPLFVDLSRALPAPLDDAMIKPSTAPLSPSASALLPSNILDDMDDASPHAMFVDPGLLADAVGPSESPKDDPQSPASSGQAMSILSSPQGSSHNLLVPPHPGESLDQQSHAMDPVSSVTVAAASNHKLGSFFSFPRSRHAKKDEHGGPALGSLKPGQSQSLPRLGDEDDGARRRITLAGSWTMFHRNSAGPHVIDASVIHSGTLTAPSMMPVSGLQRTAGDAITERAPSSPRPSSINSSEFHRPSTDAVFIWGPSELLGNASRYWSPDMQWSGTPSRRRSIHGSSSVLKTTLASADDEILDEETLADVEKVGVIGSRPPGQSKPLGRLNPTAPAFMGSFFRSKADRDKENMEAASKEVSRGKKDREDSVRGQTPRPSIDIESSPGSSVFRDALSEHTYASISESSESLSLDQTSSNTSEPRSSVLSSNLAKDENMVRKLFRRGSSGKFSFSGRLGNKKEPGRITSKGTNPEKAIFGVDLDGADEAANSIGLLGKSSESVTNSSNLGPILSSKDSGSKTKDAKVRWLSGFGKKARRDRESLEPDREKEKSQASGAEWGCFGVEFREGNSMR